MRNIVRLSSYGFWTLEVVDQLAQDLKHVRSIVGAHRDCLVDSSRCEVRMPEVAEALARLARSEDHVFVGRTAMVMDSTLLKMQNRRFLGATASAISIMRRRRCSGARARAGHLIRLPPTIIRCSCSRRRPSAAPR